MGCYDPKPTGNGTSGPIGIKGVSMKAINLKNVSRKMFVDTGLVLGRDCGDFTLSCPFCGQEWAKINEKGYVDPYHLANDLRAMAEDQGWFEDHCCPEMDQWIKDFLLPAKWRVWRNCAGCPNDVTPRQFLAECLDPFAVPCPPDRDEQWWGAEVEEAAASRSDIHQLAEQLAWALVGAHPDRLYFRGLVIEGCRPQQLAEGQKVLWPTRRWWDNRPEPCPSQTLLRAMKLARKRLDGIITLEEFKEFLRPTEIPDFGPSASEILGLYNALDPTNRWRIFGDRDPRSFFDF